MKTAQEAPAPSNAFLQVMQTHDGGEICNELAEAMREATQAVGLSGKASTVEFKVKPTAPGERYDSKIPFAIAAMLAPCAVVAYAAGRSYGRSNPND